MASDPHDFTQGLRIRQTYCVPRNFSHGVENPNEIQIWRKMVDPRKCPGDRPQRIQDCKRLPCPAKWVSLGKLYSLLIARLARSDPRNHFVVELSLYRLLKY